MLSLCGTIASHQELKTGNRVCVKYASAERGAVVVLEFSTPRSASSALLQSYLRAAAGGRRPISNFTAIVTCPIRSAHFPQGTLRNSCRRGFAHMSCHLSSFVTVFQGETVYFP
jgi:hypothetical protein